MTARLLGLTLSLLVSGSAWSINSLSLNSDPSDFVLIGKSRNFTESSGSYSATSNSVTFTSATSSSQSWTIELSGPNGAQLSSGPYWGADSYTTQSSTVPHINIVGEGRKCPKATGRFWIDQISYRSDGVIDKLSARFTQSCVGGVGSLRGAIAFNSDNPPQTELAMVVYVSDPTQEGQQAVLDGSLVFSPNGKITSYKWTQTGGSKVTLDSSTVNPRQVFTVPQVDPEGEDLQFQLEATDEAGGTGSILTTVRGTSKNARQTGMMLFGATGEYITGGINQSATLAGGYTFTPKKEASDNAILFRIDSADKTKWWNLSFAAINKAELAVGSYAGTERYPFQASTLPGLDISGSGRGCNKSKGSFTVLDYAVTGGTVDRFAAEFVQYCDSATIPLRGYLYYNYLPPNPPVASAGPDQTVRAGDDVTLTAIDSSDVAPGKIASYYWRQLSGTPVVLVDNTTVNPKFIAPGLTASETLKFRVRVTDNQGYTGVDDVEITINPNPEIPEAPQFTAQIGGTPEATDLSVRIRVAAADVSKDGALFVAARVGEQIYAFNGNTWQRWTFGPVPSAKSGPLRDSTFPLLRNTDVRGLSGVMVFAGYGSSSEDMLRNRRYQLVHTFP
ncbi:PKD domain-containing protein [Parachitinimonas caeni]|uniref:Uncharacterized protein n=1 Tax=Parachitinimonas caeni TaxID=3031301 RepID=A0ABT7DQZ3_9NEIS|nr:hypothetical protein [Parachitinimonas caeni]MDK2122491.1 hypothetical protein [Parachitinimonas caeni]